MEVRDWPCTLFVPFFHWYWGLTPGPHTCRGLPGVAQAGLKPTLQHRLALSFSIPLPQPPEQLGCQASATRLGKHLCEVGTLWRRFF